MANSPPQLDDLITMNREIAALVQAGVPLELGLRGLVGNGASRFEQLADRLANRLSSGQSLANALNEEGTAVSPVYTAVIEAGLASGKLPQALESLAASGQILQETRRRIGLAAIYPAICLVVAYALFCQFVIVVAPRLLAVIDFLPNQWPVRLLEFLSLYRNYITMVVPASIFAAFVVTFLLRHGLTRSLWQWLTSFRWVIGRSLNLAQFTELLAMQIEQKTPLSRAIVLAAYSTSDSGLQRQMLEAEQKLKNGSTLADSLRSATLLPPLVHWMLASGERQGTLEATLRQLSETYRRRALYRAAIVKVWLPVVMTIGFTGFVGLAYGLGFVIPLRAFLQGLMQE